MCRIHHKIVDDHPEIYSIENLRTIRADHETWVDSQLSGKEKDARLAREKYSVLLAATEKQLCFDKADRWLSFMGSNEHPRIEKKFLRQLIRLSNAGRTSILAELNTRD